MNYQEYKDLAALFEDLAVSMRAGAVTEEFLDYSVIEDTVYVLERLVEAYLHENFVAESRLEIQSTLTKLLGLTGVKLLDITGVSPSTVNGSILTGNIE